MEILGKILGSPARVKIMRLFLLNKEIGFQKKDIAKRSQVSDAVVARELRLLSTVDFIKRRSNDWFYNASFKYREEFENLLVTSEAVNSKTLADNFKKAGKIKLFLVSGVFLQNSDSRVDILIVGDKIKRNKTEEEIKKLEAEIGKELVYAIFETKEFIYRLNMYDKLVRDILDFPHHVVLQAKELSTQVLNKA